MSSQFSPILLPESDAELLAQCDVETFRAGGKGGQHVNTTESAVRLRHRATGVTATSQAERSQHRNKTTALRSLRRKLERLNYRAAPRIATRPTTASKRRTLQEKSAHSKKKQSRSKPRFEDE